MGKAIDSRASGGLATAGDLLDVGEKTDVAPVRAARPMIDKVLAGCGARPWDRDPIDARIVADVKKDG
jgi:hypothetical protein